MDLRSLLGEIIVTMKTQLTILSQFLAILSVTAAVPSLLAQSEIQTQTEAAVAANDTTKITSIIRSRTDWDRVDWGGMAGAICNMLNEYGIDKIPLLAVAVAATESWTDVRTSRGATFLSFRVQAATRLHQLLGLGEKTVGVRVTAEGDDVFYTALAQDPRAEVIRILNQAKARNNEEIQPLIEKALWEVNAIPRIVGINMFNASYIEAMTPTEQREFRFGSMRAAPPVSEPAPTNATKAQSGASVADASTAPAALDAQPASADAATPVTASSDERGLAQWLVGAAALIAVSFFIWNSKRAR